jgi:hypothetical protein
MDKNNWISLKEKYPDMKETYCSQCSRGWLSGKVLVQTKNGVISLLNVQEQEILNGRRMKKCGIPMVQVDEEWL